MNLLQNHKALGVCIGPKKNKGLGRGLSALFGDQKNPENTSEIRKGS